MKVSNSAIWFVRAHCLCDGGLHHPCCSLWRSNTCLLVMKVWPRARIAAHGSVAAAQSSWHAACVNGAEMNAFGLEPGPRVHPSLTHKHTWIYTLVKTVGNSVFLMPNHVLVVTWTEPNIQSLSICSYTCVCVVLFLCVSLPLCVCVCVFLWCKQCLGLFVTINYGYSPCLLPKSVHSCRIPLLKAALRLMSYYSLCSPAVSSLRGWRWNLGSVCVCVCEMRGLCINKVVMEG